MYCLLNDAYGSTMSDTNSSNESFSNEKTQNNLTNHKYYLEQFFKMKNETITSMQKKNNMFLFNEVFDHINNCYSCKLYLNKSCMTPDKYQMLEKKKKVSINVKDLIYPMVVGLGLIIVIDIIVNISNK